MVLTGIDWAIIAAYFLASLLIGLYYSRRAGRKRCACGMRTLSS